MSGPLARQALGSSFQLDLLVGGSAQSLASLAVCPPSLECPSGSRYGENVWIYPASHEAAKQRPSGRTLNFERLLVYPCLLDAAKRYLLVQAYFPVERMPGFPALRKRCDYVCRLLQHIGELEGDQPLANISLDLFYLAFQNAFGSLGIKSKTTVAEYFVEINDLGHKGRLPQYFKQLNADQIASTAKGKLSGDALDTRPETEQNDIFGVYLPLPEQYVAGAGQHWNFYVRVIQPQMVELFKSIVEIQNTRTGRRKTWRGNDGELTGGTEVFYQQEKIKELLATYRWNDGFGEQMLHLPFDCEVNFPPVGLADVYDLFSTSQAALLQLLFLLTGGRAQEVQSLSRDCLVSVDVAGAEGQSIPSIKGHDFKPDPSDRGRARSWPLPVLIARAVGVQCELAGILAPKSSGLWVSMNRAYFKSPSVDSFSLIKRFSRIHRLDHLLDGPGIHPHRFRKTIAKLAVAALTGAPMILMQIFGHADLTATMKYILADRDIVNLLAKGASDAHDKTVQELADDLDACGGPAADSMRKERDRFFASLHIPKDSRATSRVLAEFLEPRLETGEFTLKMIFPGVICTRPIFGAGACGREAEEINVGKCKPTCPRFLVMSWKRSEIASTIEFLLSELAKQSILENPLLLSWYVNQLKDNMNIFDDLAAVYSKDERVISIFERYNG